ncbi:decapping endonuclease targeting mRNA [Puccinia graminis f. sp. tritici]|uniref:Decapping nuclease n=1 Tax=Puccinia graminis f. sp. tritici TaxID=56615 RepID=A0A5B0QQ78_PUCGR|nr:decapping endonuclease targeting mRNA [Puccinia graminis f. sp. tritici]
MRIDFNLLSCDPLTPPSSPKKTAKKKAREKKQAASPSHDHHQQTKKLARVVLEAIPISNPTRFILPKPVYNNEFPHQSARPFKQNYQTPTPITSFSYDQHGKIHCGAHDQFISLRPFLDNVDHTGFDLNTGIDEAVYAEDAVDRGIDGLLLSLADFLDRSQPADRLTKSREILSTELITWRSALAKLALTAYENRQIDQNASGVWTKRVMLIDGTIYLEDEPEQIEDLVEDLDELPAGYVEEDGIIRRSDEWAAHTYHGYSYESLMTNTEFQPVNTHSQWISVVSSTLNGIPIILGGEVDCVTLESFQKIHTPNHHHHHHHQESVDHNHHPLPKFVEPDQTIELKTSIVPSTTQGLCNLHRYKMIKYWLQSFLMGTPKVHVGFRTREGILHSSKTYQTNEIPGLVKREAQPYCRWSSDVCLETGTKIIRFLKNKLARGPVNRKASRRADPSAREAWINTTTTTQGYSNRSQFFNDRLDAIVAEEYARQVVNTRPQEDPCRLSDICKAQVMDLGRWPVYRLVFKPYAAPDLSPTQSSHAPLPTGIPAFIQLEELSFKEVSESILCHKPKTLFNLGYPSTTSTTAGSNDQDFNCHDRDLDSSQPSSSHRVGFLPLFWVQRLVQMRVDLLLSNHEK